MIKVYATIEEKNNVILNIPYKKAKVKATFEGGNVFRGTHAKLYTSDPFVQKALEESPLCGKLYKLVQTIREQKDDDTTEERENGKTGKRDTEETEKRENGETGKRDTEETGKSDDGKAEEGNTEDGKKLEFADAAEAIAYIAGTYQVQVTSETEARKYLKEQGLSAVIHKAKE